MHLKSITLHPERYPTTEHYPFNLDIFRETSNITFNTPVTFFAGENGTGKSTLLEAIARKCGIHIWESAGRRRFESNPYEKSFRHYIRIESNSTPVSGAFWGSSIFNDFTRMLDDWASADPGLLEYFGGRSLVTQSHGQSIMSFFRARCKREGLYLLDEPETALSPGTQLELLDLLSVLVLSGHAQFIIATHSPILLSCPGAVIYSFDGSPVSEISYKDTGHFRVYRDFFKSIDDNF